MQEKKQKVVSTFLDSLLTGLVQGSIRPPRPVRTNLDAGPFRKWIAPLLLILLTPFIAVIVWMTATHYNGSILLFARAGLSNWIAYLPAPSVDALIIIVLWTFAQWLLLRFLPGKKIYGPITPAGNRPCYRQNGVLAWIVTHLSLFGILYPLGIVNPAALYSQYGSLLVTLNIGALAFCILLYIKGHYYPGSSDTVYTGNLLFDFFQGIELYPTFAGVSLKQLINCRVSMMGWSTVFISFLLTQYELYGVVSSSMLVSVSILVVYLFKFFVWERGYLYSLDIMHDRFGYYICWGVLVWVPSVYCLIALYLVSHPIPLSPAVTVFYLCFGLVSVWLNYNADAQRRRVRDSNGNCKIWGKDPLLIHAEYQTEDGKIQNNLLLLSGWWGLARHFHYVPELCLALAWTIPAGFTHFLPWFYFIFLFILLMDRARRDDKRCAKKYGPYWEQYKQKVPYKVLPGLY